MSPNLDLAVRGAGGPAQTVPGRPPGYAGLVLRDAARHPRARPSVALRGRRVGRTASDW